MCMVGTEGRSGEWGKLGPRELTFCLSPCPRLTHSLLLFLLLLPFPGHRRDPLPSDGESPGPALLGGQGVISIPQTILEHLLCIRHHATCWRQKVWPKVSVSIQSENSFCSVMIEHVHTLIQGYLSSTFSK